MSDAVRILTRGPKPPGWEGLEIALTARAGAIFLSDVPEAEADLVLAHGLRAVPALPGNRLIVHLLPSDLEVDPPPDLTGVERFLCSDKALLELLIRRLDLPASRITLLPAVSGESFRSPIRAEQTDMGLISASPAALAAALDLLVALYKDMPDAGIRLRLLDPLPETARDRMLWRRINSAPGLRYAIDVAPEATGLDAWLSETGFLLIPPDFSHDAETLRPAALAAGTLPMPDVHASGWPPLLRPALKEMRARLIAMLSRSQGRIKLLAQARNQRRIDHAVDKTLADWHAILHPAGPAAVATAVRRVLVVWGIADWEGFHRREMLIALADNLPADSRLLFIDPHSHYATLLKRDPAAGGRLRDEALLHPRSPHPGVLAMRLLTGGLPPEIPTSPLLKRGLSRGDLAEAVAREFFGPEVVITHWLYKPDQFQILSENADAIYEVYDDYTLDFSSGAPLPEVERQEALALAAARHVFFTSDVLAQRKGAQARSHSTVTNGVALSAFAAARGALPETAASGARPLVGYLGNLSDFFDWELMAELCEGRPQTDFLLCGNIEWGRLGARSVLAEKMMSLPNVVFTGAVARPEGAAAMACCDALIIPFRVNLAMDAVNPLKLWEYFSLGLPVVSSPMQTINLPSPLLRIAREVTEWQTALTDALASDDPVSASRRRAMAAERDWHILTRRYLRDAGFDVSVRREASGRG
ncbi:hypothetical protein GCM10007291_41710 [Gemmobacter nanjingensis]|uniref:Uncharacterized protein n=1 Tax=Gemmobacter nanjingensis TaxID=488454 RepID=A0ABQ3FRP2_9RHOB|nr:hypothetical protein [Gemmobacter nanjingensis]GHC35976.1 hypothetical protein GCM10007291_41710 [Gemmobacter nanjingensis]